MTAGTVPKGKRRLRQITRLCDTPSDPGDTSSTDLRDIELAYSMFERWRREFSSTCAKSSSGCDGGLWIEAKITPEHSQSEHRALNKQIRTARIERASIDKVRAAALDNASNRPACALQDSPSEAWQKARTARARVAKSARSP